MGNTWTNDVSSKLQLKASQHRIIQEGSSLYDDLLPDIIRTFGTYDLIQCIFYDTHT